MAFGRLVMVAPTGTGGAFVASRGTASIVRNQGAYGETRITNGSGLARLIGATLLLFLAGSPVGALEVRRLPFGANDLAADPTGHGLYASVRTPGHPNDHQIVRLDLPSGTVASVLGTFAEDYAGELGIDPGGRALYARTEGFIVQRFALVDGVSDLTIDARPTFESGYWTGERPSLAVSPLFPTTVVLGFGGALAVYDDGVPRPGKGSGSPAFFGTDPSRLHAGGVERWRLQPDGLVSLGGREIFGEGEIAAHDGEWVYDRAGRAADAETLRLVGTYPGINRAAVVADRDLGRVYFVDASDSTNGGKLRIYDRTTFVLTETIALGRLEIDDGDSLVRWGPDALAFRTGRYRPEDGAIWLVSPDLGACTDAAACDDGNPCTQDLCTDTGCRHPAAECGAHGCPGRTTCDPLNGCAYSFFYAGCEDDGDACTVDHCGPSGCEHEPPGHASDPACRGTAVGCVARFVRLADRGL